MKSYRQFVIEANIAGRFTKTAIDVMNPITEPLTSAVTSSVSGGIPPLFPKRIRPIIKKTAPLVGTAAGMAKYAPHISAAIVGLNAGSTAKGRVKTGMYRGKPVYMDK